MKDLYLTQYLFLIVFLVVAVGFPLAPLIIARLLAPRRPTQTKNDTYECGLTSKGDAWVQFRVGYYIYALMYVIFAVETVFLYPWAVDRETRFPLRKSRTSGRKCNSPRGIVPTRHLWRSGRTRTCRSSFGWDGAARGDGR